MEGVDVELGGKGGRQRCSRHSSWKCWLVFLVCTCNLAMTGYILTQVIPLQAELKTLKEVTASHPGKGTDASSAPLSKDASGLDHQPGAPGLFTNRTRRAPKKKRKTCADCDCSALNVKHGRKCRKCCQFELLKKRVSVLHRNVTKLQDILSTQMNTAGDFAKTHDQLYESRVGHFEGSKTLKPGCSNALSGYRLTTTAGGAVCMWQYADWMTDEAKQLYELDEFGKVKVTQSGIYFIYGQLIQHDVFSYASSSLLVGTDPNGAEREIAQCSETASATGTKTIRTCYLGVLTRLETDSLVFLRLNTAGKPLDTFHQPTTAFFGFIKLS